MSKTLNSIYVDFHKTQKQADKLDEAAAKLERIAKTDINQGVQELSCGWRGENAQRFIAKELVLKEDIAKTAKELRSIAEAIHKVAKKAYEADKKALEIVLTN